MSDATGKAIATSHEGASPRAAPTFKPILLAPSYNNAQTLRTVLDSFEHLGLPILVVNDGATDRTAEILAEWQAQAPHQHHVVTHDRNRGKGVALKTGFAAARKLGCTHAITIDTDGQLDPGDVPRLLNAARANCDAIVIGSRSESVDGLPGSNLVGWYTTALGIWLETGLLIPDNQCGLRVYPLHMLEAVRCVARRFALEGEILVRAAWARCPIVQVAVSCRYLPAGERVSHFRAWRDGIRALTLHAGLTIRQLIPLPHKAVTRSTDSEQAGRTIRHPIRRWLSPLFPIQQLRESRLHQLLLAGSFGIGTFMANMPLPGLQPLLALLASKRLHISVYPTVFASLLAYTNVGAMLHKLAIAIGNLVLRFQWIPFDSLPSTLGWEAFRMHGFAWLIGSAVTGLFCNWIVIGGLVLLFRLVPVKGAPSRAS